MASARQFPFYAAFWKGFHDREFYVNVASSWRARGFFLMAVVVLVTVLPASILAMQATNQLINEEFPHILPQFPEMQVVNGKLKADVAQPFVMTGSEGRKVLAIDTTGATVTPQELDVMMLLTAEQLIVRLAGDSILPFPLSFPADIQKVDSNTLVSVSQWFQSGGYISATALALVMTYLFRLVVGVIYAFAGMLFTRNQNLEMGFGALFQIALVAQGLSLIAVMVLAFVLAFIGVVSVGTLGGVLIALFLVWFGVKANRDWLTTSLPPIKERF